MRALLLTLAASLAAVPAVARAEEPQPPEVIPEKARALADTGRAFYEAADYGNAIIAFKEAYVMAPSPGLLFNLAQAYRLAGNCDDAAMMYRRYLAAEPGSAARAVAQAHLETVERCVHKAALNIPQDPAAPTVIPTDRASGSLFALAPRSHRGDVKKDIGIGLGIGGGVALSVATYYAFRAHDASTAVEHAYATGGKWQDIAETNSRGERDARYAKLLGLGGGLALAGGITLYVIGARAERQAPISLAPTQHGAEVHIAGRF